MLPTDLAPAIGLCGRSHGLAQHAGADLWRERERAPTLRAMVRRLVVGLGLTAALTGCDQLWDARGDATAPPPPIAAPQPNPKPESEPESSVPKGIAAELISVTDGDTVKVRVGGKVERVRLIGIDTPETKNSPRGPQPFADEATAAVTKLLGDGKLRLRLDAEERDRYGRLLAYIYADDGTFINEAMIRKGWARSLRVPPNVRHAKHFDALADEARRARRGIWANR